MKRIGTWLAVGILIISMPGCGGSGGGGSSDSGGNGGGGQTTSVGLDTAPTASLTASQSNADSFTAEIQQSAQDIVSAAQTPTTLPAGVETDTLPGGVTSDGSIDCSTLGTTGSGNITYHFNFDSPIKAGNNYTYSYNDCTYTASGTTFSESGTASLTYTRYTSGTDYAFSLAYQNFIIDVHSASLDYHYGPLNVAYNFDNKNGTLTTYYSLSNGGSTNISSANIAISGTQVTINSGIYVYKSQTANGIVKVEFDHWTYDTALGHPISGTITVTGANGSSLTISASATEYTVTYNNNGSVIAYTVSYD